MPVRLRKFIGLIIFVVVLIVYIVLAVQIDRIMPADSNIALQVFVYALAGILWVIPAAMVISWMSKQK